MRNLSLHDLILFFAFSLKFSQKQKVIENNCYLSGDTATV